MIFITYNRRLLDQVELDASFICSKCGSDKWMLNTVETKASALFGSMTLVKAVVVCKGCSKKIAKNYQNTDILQLAASKEKEFKPSFRKRFGLIILLLALFVLVVTIPTVQAILEHKKLEKDAKENFSKTYGVDKVRAWLENIQPGDFLFCNKEYDEPAIVFQVKELMPDTLILTEFEQTVSRDDFEDLNKLNQLDLGTGNSREIKISRRNFNRNIIELDEDSRNNLTIQQIRKRK